MTLRKKSWINAKYRKCSSWVWVASHHRLISLRPLLPWADDDGGSSSKGCHTKPLCGRCVATCKFFCWPQRPLNLHKYSQESCYTFRVTFNVTETLLRQRATWRRLPTWHSSWRQVPREGCPCQTCTYWPPHLSTHLSRSSPGPSHAWKQCSVGAAQHTPQEDERELFNGGGNCEIKH